jgi:hypothetical protein
MVQWQELVSIANSIILTDEDDQLIWQYETNGIYSSKSMYAIVHFRGVKPAFLPAVWDLKIPPRIQIFLWLFSQNKIMTTDNLRKRGIPKPLECMMCKELESVKHLFFECLVARIVWDDVFKVFDVLVTDFESIAAKWLCNKKFMHFNVVTFAVLWGLWNNRNSLVFNHSSWLNIKQVWRLILLYLRNWKVPSKELEGGKCGQFRDLLVCKLRTPLMLQAN